MGDDWPKLKCPLAISILHWPDNHFAPVKESSDHRMVGGQIDTGRDRDNRPESFPLACLGSWCPFPLGNTFIIVDHKGVLVRGSRLGTPLATWSEGSDNEQAFLVCLLASITSIGRCQRANAGGTPLSA
ncbi:hypothetical protein O181_081421 [Austropuccinia psidii MF-1]|uniref:Uncharacterized protein n=1 Tax=Austropuccinia psidii MF-1 TaxID=1389203 RepID=A0A9Q3IFY0_9BASI|nr:hypothetical protein [Austropuccinia psidii MF-1]